MASPRTRKLHLIPRHLLGKWVAGIAIAIVGAGAAGIALVITSPSVATTLAKEHAYFEKLLPAAQATHVAVKSGEWSQVSTWRDGALPTERAKVLIPAGISVVYNIGQSPSLDWIRSEGSLSFAATGEQSLLVETIVVMSTGRFDIGTASSPATNRIKITFADYGPISDPSQLSRGIITNGHVGIYGKPVTSFVALAGTPTAGSSQIQVSGDPQWQVGNTLLIPGILLGQDEERVIAAATSAGGITTYSLDRPLTYSHVAPTGLRTYVALENRNVMFTSQNITDPSRFGHTMFMHKMDVAISHVGFSHLGRTNKDRVLDEITTPDGQPGGGTNMRGRYALHMHRTGTDPAQTPIQVIGCFLSNGPGWGYVNHSSNVAFRDNVSFNVTGAAFVTEVGDELGSFTHNLAVNERGRNTAGAAQKLDYGFAGHGFHFQGMNIDVIDNIATGARGAGFTYRGDGFKELGITEKITVPAASLKDPSIAGGPTLSARSAPLRTFAGNEVFGSERAFTSYTVRPRVSAISTHAIDRFTVWNVKAGIVGAYTNSLTIKDSNIMLGTSNGVAIAAQGDASGWKVVNTNISGKGQGFQPPKFGITTISGGVWRNGINFWVADFPKGPTYTPQVIINDVDFGTDAKQIIVDFRVYTLKPHGSVTLNGKSVYALQQAASHVPYPSAGEHPATYIGKTNQQLWDAFGVAFGGAIAPATAVPMPRVKGLVTP